MHNLSHQFFCFFLDGTRRHFVRLDELKQDGHYAAAIETPPDPMASPPWSGTTTRPRSATVSYRAQVAGSYSVTHFVRHLRTP